MSVDAAPSVPPFDQRQRYEVVAALVGAMDQPASRVLDVGGFFQDIEGRSVLPIAQAAPACTTLTIDMERRAASSWLPGARTSTHQYAIADAGRLPLPDGAVDVASCMDVLEHVPRPNRQHVIAETLRVARRYAVFAVPIADDGAPAREAHLAAFVRRMVGGEQQQLLEHAAYGVPRDEEMLAALPGQVRSFGYGNLDRWLAMMLAKYYLLALPHNLDAFRTLDAAYPAPAPAVDRRPPFYRRFYLAAARPDAPTAVLDRVASQFSQAPAHASEAWQDDGLAWILAELAAADEGRRAAERAPLNAVIADRERVIGERDQAIADQAAVIDRKEALIQELAARVRELTPYEAEVAQLRVAVAELRAFQSRVQATIPYRAYRLVKNLTTKKGTHA